MFSWSHLTGHMLKERLVPGCTNDIKATQRDKQQPACSTLLEVHMMSLNHRPHSVSHVMCECCLSCLVLPLILIPS